MKQLGEMNSEFSKRLLELSNLQKEMEKLMLQRSTWNLEFARNDKVRNNVEDLKELKWGSCQSLTIVFIQCFRDFD